MKMKKLVALVSAAALCLGMSLTAFAADKELSPEEIQYGVTMNGLIAESKPLTDAEKAAIEKSALEALKAQYDVSGKDVIVIGYGDYTLYDKDLNKIEDGIVPNGPQTFYFDVAKQDGFVDGATIYVAQPDKNGNWVVVEGKLIESADGVWRIQVDLEHFSPVVFLKVMSNGKIVEVDKKGVPVKPATTKSPKTGE